MGYKADNAGNVPRTVLAMDAAYLYSGNGWRNCARWEIAAPLDAEA